MGVPVEECAAGGHETRGDLNMVRADHALTPDSMHVSYAVILENPSATLASENSTVEITLRDADGDAVCGDFALLSVVLPGQRVALAGVARIGGIVTHLTVRLHSGGTSHVPPLPALGPVKGRAVGAFATATITNPYPFAVDGLNVAVVARDADGRLVGAGSAPGLSLPASGSKELAVPLAAGAADARDVMFYPSFSPFSFQPFSRLPDRAPTPTAP